MASVVEGQSGGITFLRRPAPGGLPALLLHGVGSNAASFVAMMALLPPFIDAFAWNAPGYGGSAPLAMPSPTPRDYATAADAFVTDLGLSRVVVIGHSLGALFAGALASLKPERVTAMVLMSPALGYRVAPEAPLPEMVQARIDELAALGPAAFAAKRAARLVGDPKAMPDVAAAVERAMASVDPAGYAQAVRALGAGDLLADAAHFAMPVQVAYGTRDVVTPPANAHALHAALPHPEPLVAIDGAGHALTQEQPAEVARLVTRFVARCVDRHVPV